MQEKKKRNRRSKAKYPALDPDLNLKRRQDLIDYDYIDQLTEEEKKWLNDFTEGYVNADFRKKDTQKIFKKKEQRRQIYRENNARNRCDYTKAKACGGLVEYDEYVKVLEEAYRDEYCEEDLIQELEPEDPEN